MQLGHLHLFCTLVLIVLVQPWNFTQRLSAFSSPIQRAFGQGTATLGPSPGGGLQRLHIMLIKITVPTDAACVFATFARGAETATVAVGAETALLAFFATRAEAARPAGIAPASLGGESSCIGGRAVVLASGSKHIRIFQDWPPSGSRSSPTATSQSSCIRRVIGHHHPRHPSRQGSSR